MRSISVSLPMLLFSFISFSQSGLPDNFRIGDFVEIFEKDSIKIHFACPGRVFDRKHATYYRVGKMDTEIINVAGKFHDYYITGELYLNATMINNNLEGAAQYFHKNGTIKEEGIYQHNKRSGKWTYYYPDGKIQKVYDFTGEEPLIMEVYTSSGKPTVINGNGKFTTMFGPGNQCIEYEIYGEVLNGKKHGKWTWTNIVEPKKWTNVAERQYGRKVFEQVQKDRILETEIYDEGKYIEGRSAQPQIKFSNLCANENVNLLESHVILSGQARSLHYAGWTLHRTFYPELQQKLLNYTDSVKNQWLVVGISISKRSMIKSINVASSINDQKLENFVFRLLTQMTDWQTVMNNSAKIESDLFFTILIDNNQVILPVEYFNNQ